MVREGREGADMAAAAAVVEEVEVVGAVVNGVGVVFVCEGAGLRGTASDVPRLGLLILGCERFIALISPCPDIAGIIE